MEEMVLRVRFVNEKPVELNQFTLSLNALSAQYTSYIKNECPSTYKSEENKLYIKEIERGSIIIELVATCLPLIQDVNTIMEFFNYIKISFDSFIGRDKTDRVYSKNDYRQFNEILNITSTDTGSKLEISTRSGDVISNVYNITSLESNAAQNEIRRRLDIMKNDNKTTHLNKVYMRWANTNFDGSHKNYADRVIIDQIDPHPKKVVFLNENDKIIATSHNPSFSETNWQSLVYVVDVEIYYLENSLKAYTVTKLYTEDTFDPNK